MGQSTPLQSHPSELTPHLSQSPSEGFPGYLSKKQLATHLHKAERTLDRWHVLRIGPPRITVGRMILYRIEAIESWLRSREERPCRTARGRR
jgi:hypothetical protein